MILQIETTWLLKILNRRRGQLVYTLEEGEHDNPWSEARVSARLHEIEMLIDTIEEKANVNG